MPYINVDYRDSLREGITSLVDVIHMLTADNVRHLPGIINYCITMIITECFSKLDYHDIAIITGVLENAKQEFYRRYVSGYEDSKIKDYGDIPLYDFTDPKE